MRDDDHGHVFVGQLLDGLQHFAGELRIESARRLVEKHDLRRHCERPRDGDALFLPAGKAPRVDVFFIPQTDFSKQPFRCGHDVFFFHFFHIHRSRQQIVQYGHVREEIERLKDHAHLSEDLPGERVVRIDDFPVFLFRQVISFHPDRAALNGLQIIEAPQESALPRAGGTDDGDHFPFFHREAHAMKNLLTAKRFPDIFHFDKCHRSHLILHRQHSVFPAMPECGSAQRCTPGRRPPPRRKRSCQNHAVRWSGSPA